MIVIRIISLILTIINITILVIYFYLRKKYKKIFGKEYTE